MTPLEGDIRKLIERDGPQPLSRVMQLSAARYYDSRDPLGRGGDFVTSPEISQVFGELIGLWSVIVWRSMGRPGALNLVELGPGRGTLMADAMRAAQLDREFVAALRIHLVEQSQTLRAAQAKALEKAGPLRAWHAEVATVPPGPRIVIANEFFDALPVRQYVRAADGWHERVVAVDAAGHLVLGAGRDLTPPALVPERVRDAPEGSVAETSPACLDVMRRLAADIVESGGAALIIDYGYLKSQPGETLQALAGHRSVPPLSRLGEADLTAHVDFEALGVVAEAAGATVHGPITQRDFLRALGIEQRAGMLAQRATPSQAQALQVGVARLIDPSPTGMGALFKVMAVAAPGLPALPAFPPKP